MEDWEDLVDPGDVDPPPRPKRRGSLATALGIVFLLVILAVAWANEDQGTGDGAAAPPDPRTSEGDDGYTAGYTDADPEAGSDPADEPDPEPDPATPTPDPVRDATEGDCFSNYGTMQDMDLEPTSCGDGTFEAVWVVNGSTDTDDCEGTADGDWAVNYPAHEITLCLSYRHAYGSAYHAEPGDCVYGSNGEEALWEETACETGNFTVEARLHGQRAYSDCDAYTWHHARHFSVSRWPELNVLLCLTMNYPDDAGLAEVDNCMLMTESGDSGRFEFSDCDYANVYVTGRTSTYNDSAFCGDDGSTTWQNPEFPDLGYTVCWRWI